MACFAMRGAGVNIMSDAYGATARRSPPQNRSLEYIGQRCAKASLGNSTVSEASQISKLQRHENWFVGLRRIPFRPKSAMKRMQSHFSTSHRQPSWPARYRQ